MRRLFAVLKTAQQQVAKITAVQATSSHQLKSIVTPDNMVTTSEELSLRNVTAAVPMEIAQNIVSGMALEDVCDSDMMHSMFPHLDLTKVVERRLDPKRYLSGLVEDVEGLLEVMLITNSFIGGSRATEFFTPGAASSGSDWDIFCCGGQRQQRVLVDWMTDHGLEIPDESDEVNFYRRDLFIISGSIQKGRSSVRVQLVKSGHGTDINAVFRFHSSITQCLITGYAALSLMSKTTRLSKSVEWVRDETSPEAVQKYMSRGIEYVDPSVLDGEGTLAERLERGDSYAMPFGPLGLYRHEDYKLIADMMLSISKRIQWTCLDGRISAQADVRVNARAFIEHKETFYIHQKRLSEPLIKAGVICISKLFRDDRGDPIMYEYDGDENEDNETESHPGGTGTQCIVTCRGNAGVLNRSIWSWISRVVESDRYKYEEPDIDLSRCDKEELRKNVAAHAKIQVEDWPIIVW